MRRIQHTIKGVVRGDKGPGHGAGAGGHGNHDGCLHLYVAPGRSMKLRTVEMILLLSRNTDLTSGLAIKSR